nr:beta-ketoacyl-ACP synthase II [uncultured Cellulosilyticum sp.]
MENRVVITGMGVVSPLGNSVEAFWNNIKEGVCGISLLSEDQKAEGVDVHVAGLVKEFEAEKYMDRKEQKRLAKFSQYAIYAAKEALKDANVDMAEMDATRVGVIIGSGIGNLQGTSDETIRLKEKGGKRVSPLYIPMSIANMAAGNVAIYTGAKGICTSIVTACASGTHSIGEAYRNLKHGYSDMIIAGGAESCITHLAIASFNALTALSKSEDPLRASIPFDKERNGFILGEGAGILILETLEHAKERGAHIIAEIVGYGATGDAYHITSPAVDGDGAARAMRDAIREANINPDQVDYINAHGTSTHYNDSSETLAIKKVLGEDTKVPVSSTKSMTGHLLGAAGGIEAIVIAKAVQDDFIPPTIGYKVPDEECDLDYVPNEGRCAKVEYAMSNSLGFGGHNGTILVKKWRG